MDNKIHSVIFDLDGTLSDSAVLTEEAFKRISPLFGLPVPSVDAIRRATGYATPQFYHILFPVQPAEPFEASNAKLSVHYDAETVNKAGLMVEEEELRLLPSLGGKLLFKGCYELLSCLKEKNINLYIASTGQKEHVYPILHETGIIKFFKKVYCAQPDKTEMLREIIGGDDKNNFVMVGDMKKDFTAAKTNGILSVGACFGYCIKELSDFDFYIDSPLDLLSIIKI